MAAALQHPKLYIDKGKDVEEISEGPIQCTSCNTDVPFINDDLLLWSKSQNHHLFMTDYIRQ